MRIVCWQPILMKYHALFVIFEKVAKFEIVVCCKLKVALFGLTQVQINKYFERKNTNIIFSINLNICLGAQKNHLAETVLLSIYNI